MRPGALYVGEQGHLHVPISSSPTSLKNEAPTALSQCLPCQSASSTPHPPAPRPDSLESTTGKAEAVSPARPSLPTLPFGPRSSRLGSSCCPDWRSGELNPMAEGAFPREGEKKPAEQETQGRSRGHEDVPAAGWDLLLPWSCQRAAGTVLWSQAASHWYAGRKGARLGWQRAAGQDGAVRAEPAGRGSC